MIRVAAVGDLHFGPDARGTLRPHLVTLPKCADLFLLAGDFTRHGDPIEAAAMAEELSGLAVPMVAVLGNHDHHANQPRAIACLLEASGIRVLDGDAAVFEVGGVRIGVAGIKGFGGGFGDAKASGFGEPEMRAFVELAMHQACRLEDALRSLDADLRVVLLHYSPIEGTLRGERREIYPFLGNSLFADVVDRLGADLILHGHAHAGTERGKTPGGIPVRNVARPVIDRAYTVYPLAVRSHRVG